VACARIRPLSRPFDRRVLDPPQVSVLIPVLNGARFVEPAVRSALASSRISVEVIVQDGGSSDGTQAIVRSLDDLRVLLVCEPDDGQADALNRAAARARGDWLIWLNADDELAPGGLDAFAERFSSGVDLVYGDFAIVDADSRVVKRYRSAALDPERVLRRGPYVFSGAVAIRREALDRIGGLDASLQYCMDYDLLLRASRVCPARQVDGLVAYLRDHPASKSRTVPWRFVGEHLRVARRHGASLPRTARIAAEMTVLTIAAPLRRSAWWRRLRPEKTLG
jgi:glycosyltransferase involved in cell wall biosynthesis